jgi:hypothetical protein
MSQPSVTLSSDIEGSPAKRMREDNAQLIGPSFLRVHVLGFCWVYAHQALSSIDPAVPQSVTSAVKASIQHKAEKCNKLSFSQRQNPITKKDCPYGIMAGAQT